MFIISMICLMNFDKVNLKLVSEIPVYENAVDELRKVESPRRQAQAEVDFYVNKLDEQQKQEVPADKKKAKEHQEDIERTIHTLETKEAELAKVDANIKNQTMLFEAVKVPFDDLTNQVTSKKSTFMLVLWITIVLFIGKVALFAAWKYKSLQNLRITSPWMMQSTAPYWAYVSWLIPGYNFIKPYTVYNEIVNETNYALADKKIVEKDTDTQTDFNIGLWWALLLLAVLLMSILINGTFFNQGPMYFKLSHTGVAVSAIIMWTAYLIQECLVINKGVKMNQILYQNRSKFDHQ
jgi:hypothetical protein